VAMAGRAQELCPGCHVAARARELGPAAMASHVGSRPEAMAGRSGVSSARLPCRGVRGELGLGSHGKPRG
jgi:hypothetical protein